MGCPLSVCPEWPEPARAAISAGMNDAPTMPMCPRCGAPMRLARVVPAAFGYPELRSFACTVCREAVTLEGKGGVAAREVRL